MPDPDSKKLERDLAAAAGDTTAAKPAREMPGQRVGTYKLLERIGEGGFGEVWVAEQEKPVRRKVALKIVKAGMDTREVLARFEAERQALAVMDHPNVARVFDAGATDSGRPYFVMEHVSGLPITAYCDSSRLRIRDRLQLFIDICQAVQHAHQKGIIHRDLKPGNILVTLQDGKPVPKVIDFGIAKATIGRLTERTLYTEMGRLIGTPEYMSPEQAGTSGMDVDTRADIYSLGVLLYQLLTGTLPFDTATLREAGFDGIAKIIREQEPPKPSTRISTLAAEKVNRTAGATPEVISRTHGTDVRSLQKELRGDLDWIVMKALEKDRGRRYDTATSFAADVQRHLSGEPVIAAPPSFAYRARKFVRKHRGQVVAATLVAIALVLGIATTTWQWRRAEQQVRVAGRSLEEARTAKIEAEQQRNEANKLLMGLKALLDKGSRFEGSLTSQELRFTYFERDALGGGEYSGKVSFQLSADHRSFNGEWVMDIDEFKGQCFGAYVAGPDPNRLAGLWKLTWTSEQSDFPEEETDRAEPRKVSTESCAWVFTDGDKVHGYYELDPYLLDVVVPKDSLPRYFSLHAIVLHAKDHLSKEGRLAAEKTLRRAIDLLDPKLRLGPSLEGHITGRRLIFRYREPGGEGEGWFELTPDGMTFSGKLRHNNRSGLLDWSGTRQYGLDPTRFDGIWQTECGSMWLFTDGQSISGYYNLPPNDGETISQIKGYRQMKPVTPQLPATQPILESALHHPDEQRKE